MKTEKDMMRGILNAKRYPPAGGLSAGFTLVEMIIAFGIFAVIMVMSVGSLLSIMQANNKAQTEKTVVNNLHFAFENMTRTIRTGSRYHCGSEEGKRIEDPNDCADQGASFLAFLDQGGEAVIFQQNGSAIERRVGSGPAVPLTAPEVEIERLAFFVSGAEKAGDKLQPKVLILAKGTMEGKGRVKGSPVSSTFTVQTLVSQRLLDVVR